MYNCLIILNNYPIILNWPSIDNEIKFKLMIKRKYMQSFDLYLLIFIIMFIVIVYE